MTQIHHRTCNICEAMCGLVMEHDGDKVLSIRGDENDSFSGGHICPKAVALNDIHEDPDRLRRPQRRAGDRWSDCSWDEAMGTIAERVVDIQQRHGNNAVAIYVGNPTVHNFSTLLFGVSLLEGLRTQNRFSATSVDQLPHMLASLKMFGHQLLLPVPDVDRCETMLMLGANPLVSNGSLMTAPNIKKRLTALTRRGKLVVIDPRFTETAKLANVHHYIRPGSDGLLLAALCHELYATDRVRPGRLEAFTHGIESLREIVKPFTPDAVAGPTGIAAKEIRGIAKALSDSPRPCVYGRVGVCTQRFGGLNGWLVNALNVLLGSLDAVGGMMFTRPAVDLVSLGARIGQQGHFDKGRSRVRGLPEFNGEYPVVTLADEITTPGDGQIRALITMAGNPVLSTPNGQQLDKALGQLEFMASIDIYRNETTRHADYILAPTSQLEQSHYDLAFHMLAVRNTAKYSAPLFAPPPDSKADWQILLELSTRIMVQRGGTGAGVLGKLATMGLGKLGPDGVLNQLLRWGSYGKGLFGDGLDLQTLKDAPSGIDFGALEPCLPDRLYTSDKFIELVPSEITRDMARLEAELDNQPNGTLMLIGRRQLRTNNSWLHNTLRMVKGRNRCTLIMHSDDAASRGLQHGADVVIETRVGTVTAPLHVTDDIMPGVVSLPHGFGHDKEGMKLEIAERHAGVSVNDLTDDSLHCDLTGTAALNGVPVDVRMA
jgi:anaerobic selenocysteine-containing dehydrogenase